jgi:hypothetical protein
MRRALLVVLVPGVMLSLWAGLGVGAPEAAPARVIDRTLVCRMSGFGYPDSVRYMTVSASPYDPGLNVAPQMSVGNGAVYGGPRWGAYARTGPAGRQNETPTGQATLPRLAAGRCSNTQLSVPLSSKGLRGGPTTDDKDYRCNAPAKVLIRLRAIFKRPTSFRRDPRFPEQEDALGNIANAYLAVTTLRGRKPLAFASVHENGGAARVFVARSCAQTP